MIRKTKDSEATSQVMTSLVAPTIRGIVNKANEEGIQREDIVFLTKESGQYFLIYYKQ